MKPESRTVIISAVTPLIFNNLYLEHGETLSCPCVTNAIPYKVFVSNTITFHPVCTSIFVSPQWIQALSLGNASTYGVADFRTSASSQVSQIFSLEQVSFLIKDKSIVAYYSKLNSTNWEAEVPITEHSCSILRMMLPKRTEQFCSFFKTVLPVSRRNHSVLGQKSFHAFLQSQIVFMK